MGIYLKILAAFYFVGAVLHFMDVVGLRLKFSDMSTLWQTWIIFLLVLDFLAAIGLWQRKPWGIGLFLIVAISQLIAYLGFQNFFGTQWELVAFHVISVSGFLMLRYWNRTTAVI